MSELEYNYDVSMNGINVHYHMSYSQAINYITNYHRGSATDENVDTLFRAIEDDEDRILKDTIGALTTGFDAGHYGTEGGINLDEFGFKELSNGIRKKPQTSNEVVTEFEFGNGEDDHMLVKVEVTREYLHHIMYKFRIEPNPENTIEVERIFKEKLDSFKEQVKKGINFLLWTSDNWYFGIFGCIGEAVYFDGE